MPSARLAIAPASSPSRRRPCFATAGQQIGAAAPSAGATPSRNCKPCKPNTPHGPTPCPTVYATAPPPKHFRPSSNSISTTSPRSSHPVATAVTDPKQSGEFSSGAFGENSTGIDSIRRMDTALLDCLQGETPVEAPSERAEVAWQVFSANRAVRRQEAVFDVGEQGV